MLHIRIPILEGNSDIYILFSPTQDPQVKLAVNKVWGEEKTNQLTCWSNKILYAIHTSPFSETGRTDSKMLVQRLV